MTTWCRVWSQAHPTQGGQQADETLNMDCMYILDLTGLCGLTVYVSLQVVLFSVPGKGLLEVAACGCSIDCCGCSCCLLCCQEMETITCSMPFLFAALKIVLSFFHFLSGFGIYLTAHCWHVVP